jgi:acyl-CoA reductase-like NAD-dependent aldehyde dehydrogenase
MSDLRMLINGRLVKGAATLDVINPATGRPLTAAPRADRAQLDQAVAAAKAAFPGWSATPLRERGALLIKLAEALEAEQSEFARLLTEEQGKPLPDSLGEIALSIATLRYFATLDLPLEVLKEDTTQKVVRQHKPLGVVAAITPWNFPVLLLIIKVAPALLAGNTVVAKPAPTTPLTTLKFGELCARILPAGVVNIIVDRNDLGPALTGHPDVAKVAFTGSTATGKKVMESVAGTLKRLTLELGGNDAAIVLDDADPQAIGKGLFWGAFINNGQICAGVKRVFVPESLHDEVVGVLAERARRLRIGPGVEPGVHLGPIQNRMQFDRVSGLVADALSGGASAVVGGRPGEGPGYFFPPTILTGVREGMRIVDEEQFGPALPVLSYRTVDEAVERANATRFGLSGSVWGTDLDRAAAVAGRLDCGTAFVNDHLALDPALPFGGSKESGIGVENGPWGLDEFTQIQVLHRPKA